MRVRPTRLRPARRRAGAAILATAVLSGGLVAATTTTTGAAPVNTTVQLSCGGRDAATNATLAGAAGILGSDKVGVTLVVSGGDVPETAGLDQEIDAAFNWTATMGQELIDKAAALIPALTVTNINVTQLVRGPATPTEFTKSVPGPITIAPKVGVPANLPIGTVGDKITTTSGGIITYRVGAVTLDAGLSVAGATLSLKLACSVQGSNLISKTTVRDPDAPLFNPEVVTLEADAGQTVTKDLLGEVITPGKTPLMPESLKITEQPAAGSASITNGVFSFTAPAEPGTYSTTVEICGMPKEESGTPGIDEVQEVSLGANWSGDGILAPRPVAFSLKVGEEETGLIWTARHNISDLLFPLPLGGTTPTPQNWAPSDRAGLVNDYALFTTYQAPTAAQIQGAIERLPGIGAGNVVVTELKDGPNPDVVTGFHTTFVGDKAAQDVPDISLGQWYTVPPQEVFDQISAAIAALSGSLGGGEGEPTPPRFASLAEANAYIGANLFTLTEQDWADWGAALTAELIAGVTSAVPEILAWITGLFPAKPMLTTIEQGEAPVPPAPLCAQGIIDVTVAEVASETETPPAGPEVGGVTDTRGGAGIGFVG